MVIHRRAAAILVVAIIKQKGRWGKRDCLPTWLQFFGTWDQHFYWTATPNAVHRSGLPVDPQSCLNLVIEGVVSSVRSVVNGVKVAQATLGNFGVRLLWCIGA